MPAQLKAAEGVWDAVAKLANGSEEGFDVPNESLRLESVSSASLSELATAISTSEPRFSFFRHTAPDGTQPIMFTYTCPSETKARDRMLYAAARRSVLWSAENVTGVVVAKRFEGTEPDEIPTKIEEEFRLQQTRTA
ncbi:hypothetical protein K432DRAFT_444563 [Lepidopterella palustris CBS 459.81]|uniref:ADF-H domain-containing protein n=1 Tax=Lepidopterella palustris CBS 459.81 TaxID=1314670 RepID=A0A8E2E7B8_9PEZI|nr:hypothetical protein K432DRAFT_444563 [Lepidopterella palustris CBS 459.81]